MLGDGIRYNISTLPPEEVQPFIGAILKLHKEYFFPDGVSGWFKQDQIHQSTHVHGGAGFIPWHRELCNRFEALLREIDPRVSLHYWDFQEDVEEKNILGPNGMFGASHGIVGPPFDTLHNKGMKIGCRDEINPPDPAKPPEKIVRDVKSFPFLPEITDEMLVTKWDELNNEDQWNKFRNDLEFVFHGPAHEYIGGNLSVGRHTAFEDPFVFLLHSNVDRLWASWQFQPGKTWRLDPDKIYGFESEDEVQLNEFLEPWAGGASRPQQKMRPWGFDWPAELKNAKDISIVRGIPKYDKYANL